MGLGSTFKQDLALHISQNANIANLGDATGLRGSTTAGSGYVALHTGDPTAGDQTTSEATYTGYARVAVARTSGGFTCTAGTITNTALVTFPACTGGSSTCTHFSVGSASSGASEIWWCGELGSNQGAFTALASTDVFTAPGHSFAVNDTVVFHAVSGSSLPTGVTDGTIYFIKTVPVASQTFTISATQGGATLDVTADGDGMCFKDVSLAVTNGITPQAAIGALSAAFA
jgi:hypothetical protein